MSVARAETVRQRSTLTPGHLSGLLMLAEASIVFCVGLVIFAVYVWPSNPAMLSKYLAALAMYVVVMGQAFNSAGLYRLDRIVQPQRYWRKVVTLCISVFAALLVCAFAFKISAQYSRVWGISWLVSIIPLLVSFRFTMAAVVRRSAMSGALTRNIIIYGAGDNGKHLINYIERLDEPWNRVVGVFDDRSDRVPDQCGDFPVLGDIESLVDYARAHSSDEILLALPSASRERIIEIVAQLNRLPVNVRLVPNLALLYILDWPVSREYGVPMINVLRKPVSDWGHVGKRLTDFLVTGAVLAISSPVVLLIAILIKLDSKGPVLFRQQRHGFQNQIIDVLKFRTMYVDQTDAGAEQLTIRNDPRVTRVGKWLRRFSLDELPQLINVIKGDMSLVGPRPHALKARAGGKLYADVIDAYAVRMKVKPGITGWAQVNGYRGNTETEDDLTNRVKYDLFYIDNWSVRFDLFVIFKTLLIVLKSENSY